MKYSLIGAITAAAAFIATPALADPQFPDCHAEDLPYEGEHVDCAVSFEFGDATFVAQFDFEPADYGETVLVLIINEVIVDQFEVEIEGTFAYPIVEDLDGDGFPEIQVPQYTGNVNTYGMVYHLDGGARWIVQSPMPLTPEGDGIVSVWERSSAVEGTASYFRIGDEGMSTVLSINVNWAEIDGGNLDGGCIINGDPESVGLSVEDIIAKHCTL